MRGWSWSALGNRPFFFPAWVLVLGIWLGPLLACSVWAAGLAGAVAAGVAWWRAERWGATLAVFLGFGSMGAALALTQMRTHVEGALVPGQSVVLEGELEQVTRVDDGVRLTIAVTRAGSQPQRFRALLSARDAPESFDPQPGQRLAVSARLRPTAPAGNPGESTRYLLHQRRGQTWSGSFDAERVVLLSSAPAWRRWRAGAHARLAEDVRAVAPDEAAAALLLTLGAGLRAELDATLEEAFSKSGLAHVLSVSGLHVAVLALALFRVVRWTLVRVPGRVFRRVDPRALAAPLALPLVWGYVVYTGSQAPAVRSAVMCSLLLLSHALRRRSDPLNALALAGCLMAVADPAILFDLSMQLSFVAVASLVILTPTLRAALPFAVPSPATQSGWHLRWARWREAAVLTFVASVAVTLATAPLVLSAFQRVGVAGLVSNVVCLPISAVLTLLASSGAALHLAWPPAAMPVLWLGAWCARGLVLIAQGFASVPGSTLSMAAPPFPVWLVWWAALAAMALLRGRWRWVALAGPLTVSLHWAVSSHTPEGQLVVTFLAVGHGDAVVLSSEGHHALVDGGGVPDGPDTGERFVLPFLRSRRISHLDLAALSHAHPDHALGLISALRSVSAARLWLPAGMSSGALVDELREAAGAATVTAVEAGHSAYTLGAARVEVLGPPRDRALLEGENDRSLVLRVRHGEVTFLLPGDLEAAGEEFLDPGPISVMKAPHHGSRTSSTELWVERSHPRYVVFCVGRHNRFGFPSTEVVERYTRVGSQCYRTDLDGAITFRSNGSAVTVETFRARETPAGAARAGEAPELATPSTSPSRSSTSADAAFNPGSGPRWDSIRSAHAAIRLMFWGARVELDDACAAIRAWVTATFG